MLYVIETIQMSASIGPGGWILGNYRGFGYYRINYDDDTWLNLCNQLQQNHLVRFTLNRNKAEQTAHIGHALV